MSSVDEKLRAAAGYGNEAELKELLRDPSCNALNADEMGMTALMWAAYQGHEACVRLLLPVSAAPAKNKNRQTALMCAGYGGHEACVRLLLPVSDASAADADGWTTLMWAANYGHEDCVQLLLPLSDVQARDNNGLTASYSARSRGCESVAQFIDAYALAQTEHATIEEAASPSTPRKRAAQRV